MLKIFRKTWRSLIDLGELSNYLLYAIGEIALVVIITTENFKIIADPLIRNDINVYYSNILTFFQTHFIVSHKPCDLFNTPKRSSRI